MHLLLKPSSLFWGWGGPNFGRSFVGWHVLQRSQMMMMMMMMMMMIYSNIYPTRCKFTQSIYIWKLLYMFRRYLHPPSRAHTTVPTCDGGWRYHPKYVEQFPDINKLCKFASCWMYIGMYLRCTDP